MDRRSRERTIALGLALGVAGALLPAGASFARGRPDTAGLEGRARAVAAHELHGSHGPAGGRPAWAGQGPAGAALGEPAFVAQVTPVGVAGSFLNVRAKVKVPGPKDPSVPFTATATVDFASGPVEVDLLRMGRSLVAKALVPVDPLETPGPVAVHVDVVYGVGAESFVLTTTILAPGEASGAGDADESDEPDESDGPEAPGEESPDLDDGLDDVLHMPASRGPRAV
jgi:hypothetical protein